jgi:hypothetical protein
MPNFIVNSCAGEVAAGADTAPPSCQATLLRRRHVAGRLIGAFAE